MKSRQEKANGSKSRWPHALNVVTNFSKPPQLAQQAADTSRRHERDAVAAFERRHERSDNSTNVKTPNAYKGMTGQGEESQHDATSTDGNASVSLGFQRYETASKAPSPPRDNKGPIHDLMRASSKMTTLSPSDRPIVIGISVPSDRLDQHTVSPVVGPTPGSNSSKQYARDRRPSEAPTVAVTPAKADAPRSAGLDDQPGAARRRAPSSLYSRPTNARNTPKPADVPPMPTARRRSFPLRLNGEHSGASNGRLMSTCTVFDEDNSPKTAAHERRYSGESQLRILKRSSTDSIATRHRSQGWWNHILSPFLPKPGAVPWRSASKETEPVSDLPHFMSSASPTSNGEPSGLCSPALRPRFRRSSSGHTSIWTDYSQIEAERQPADIAMLRSPFHKSPRVLENPSQDLSDWFEGLGAAAEYYHGCWHDQNSLTPYFDCQNHVCIPRRPGNFPLPQGPQDQSRGLLYGNGDNGDVGAHEPLKHTEVDEFQQTPGNRFSAAFKEAVAPKSTTKDRPLSETTVIEDVDATPVVREAQAAPVVRAPAPVSAVQLPSSDRKAEEEATEKIPEASTPARCISKQPLPAGAPMSPGSRQPGGGSFGAIESPEAVKPPKKDLPASSRPRVEKPTKRFIAVMPPGYPSVARAQPESLGGASPAVQTNGSRQNAIDPNGLSWSKGVDPNESPSAVYSAATNHYHGKPYGEAKSDQVTLADMEPPPRPRWSSKDIKASRETEKMQSVSLSKKRRGCPPALTGCFHRGEPRTKKQKWLLVGITSALVAMIILILLLAMLLTRKGDHMDVQSQWLNLTGFPPIPTGISTIIQPDPVQEASGCIHPATLWSCAVPKEQQSSIAPNALDQPNFRIEIRFQNGSIAEGAGSNNTGLRRRSDLRVGNAVTAGKISRRRLLHMRDFAPAPAPPTREDQIFLGNTTDQNQQPFDGVATPFFISFMNPEQLPSLRMSKRASIPIDTNSTGNNTDPFPSLGSVIPPPSTNADGTASPASLVPLVSAQPLRLYDRDQDTEHYGFYTYFDRSIFLKSTALLNFTGTSPSEIPDDENGGADENAAKVRCTWAQTRFLVQIWTRKGNTSPLLQSSNFSTSSSPDSHPKNLTLSSANNFTRPGSFPYPVSITLDRHGGDIKKKMIYCYRMDQQERIISDEKQIQLEDRAFGGALVNPAQGPFGEVKVSGDDGGPGGIDGGRGGCGCRWENFSHGT